MWTILEHNNLQRTAKKLPTPILKQYEKWKDIVQITGPNGLKSIKGFHDEALSGKWRGYRSSRLGLQYRVLYKVDRDHVLVFVFDVTAHDYRKR